MGTKIAPPFTMKADDGSWEEISIELWDEIAKELALDYEWQETLKKYLGN
ncbi:MAG: transporter substrate-binding domain-containing protein [Desulfuromusa sp.]|nr:transporter substrate-binding domain-containing protein [Desulfuromusa sp.]